MLSPGSTKLYVFDLDGTILNCNSFHVLIFYLILYALRTLNISLFITIILSCLLRVLKQIDHLEFKCKISMGYIHLDRSLQSKFIDKLLTRVRPEMLEQIERVKAMAEAQLILSTAAPDFYATGLGERLGFEVVLSTRITADSTKCIDNKGMNKIVSISDCSGISCDDVVVEELFTDHLDDYPLMKCSRKVVLVSPGEKTLDYLKQKGFSTYEVIASEKA